MLRIEMQPYASLANTRGYNDACKYSQPQSWSSRARAFVQALRFDFLRNFEVEGAGRDAEDEQDRHVLDV